MGRPCRTRTPLVERFWKAVEKTETCWLWRGARKTFGYGVIGSGGNDSTSLHAHRVSWEIHHGQIPNGLQVLHRCDVPACVNPDHLFLGTQGDNMRDAVAKGRWVAPRTAQSGEGHGSARLTAAQVADIRERYAAGNVTQVALGLEFGIKQGHVSGIILRKAWKSCPRR